MTFVVALRLVARAVRRVVHVEVCVPMHPGVAVAIDCNCCFGLVVRLVVHVEVCIPVHLGIAVAIGKGTAKLALVGCSESATKLGHTCATCLVGWSATVRCGGCAAGGGGGNLCLA